MFKFKKRIKYKKITKIVAPVLLVVLISTGYFILSKPKIVSASWWNDSWMYRRSIAITNNTSAQTNVFTSETIDTSATTTLQADCGDLRFVTESGEVLLYYIVSGCGTASTIIHTQFTTFPAGQQTIYYYYGNPSAPNGFSSSDFTTEASNYTIGSISSEEAGGGPISYWSFDDPSAGTEDANAVHDESGQGYNGTNYNAVQKPESECQIGKCMYLDGLSQTRIEADTKDNMTEFTACLWIKANSLTNTDNDSSIELFYKGWYLNFNNLGKIEFRVRTSGSYPTVFSSENIETNKWYNICAVHNGIGVNPNLYINGLNKSTSQDDGSGTIQDNYNLIIGSGDNYWANNFQGYIDDVKIYPYARTADQIKQDYNAGLAGQKTKTGTGISFGAASDSWLTDGLVGYWKMDESATTSGAIDSSGNNNTGTYVGNASTTAGKFGRGLVSNFDEDLFNIDALELGGNGEITDISTSTRLSFFMWVNFNTSDMSWLFSKDAYASGWGIIANVNTSFEAAPGYLLFNFGDQDSNTREKAFSVNINDSNWHHIGFSLDNNIYDGLIFYMDGVEIGRMQSIANFKGIIGGTNYLAFNGRADEVRIYNRAFSAGEVAKLYEWAPEPVLHLKMDEKSGATAYDDSGYGNNGTLVNGPIWVRGKYGSAVKFDGVNDEINLGMVDSLDMHDQDLTMSAWVNIAEYKTYGHIISKAGGSSTNKDYRIQFDETDANLEANVFNNSGSSAARCDFATPNYNEWHYFTYTYSGGYGKCYLDGTLVNTSSQFTGIRGGSTDYAFTVGSRDDGSFFSGSVDDVRIYNYARTQKQILEDMSGGDAGVGNNYAYSLHFSFDEGYGGTAYDGSINGSNGTLHPGTSGSNTSTSSMWTNEGKFGKAIEFDGTDDYVQVSNNKVFDSNEGTIRMWIKTDGSWAGNNAVIFGRADTSASCNGLIIACENNSNGGRIALAAYGDSCSGHWVNWPASFNSNKKVTNNSWHQILLTYNQASGSNLNLYIDGILDYSTTTQAAWDFNEQNIYLGDHTDSWWSLFNGLIDEVKIYPYALTADEVKSDYNQGKSIVMGQTGQSNSVATSSNSASLEYCVPGSTDPCAAPIAEWKFNEKSGTTAYDTGGSGYNGTLYNAPVWIRGKMGNAINFDGSDDYVKVSATMDLSYLTISAWIKMDSYGEGTYGRIVDKQNLTDSDESWCLHVLDTKDLYFSSKWNTQFGGWGTTNHSLGLSGWYHVAVTYDYTTVASDPIIYINGVKQAVGEAYAPSGTKGPSTSAIYIGNNQQGTRTFDGLIDDFKIYNYIRTPAQIAYEYNRGKPIAEWKFDECQGGTIHDESGNGNNGTLQLDTSGITATGTCNVSASSFWYNGRTGKVNSGGSFDGWNDNVDIGNNSKFNLLNNFTLSFWLKKSSASTDISGIIERGSDGNNGYEAAIGTRGCGSNKFVFSKYSTNHFCIGNVPMDTSWHHYLVTVSNTGGITLYVDGQYNGNNSSTSDIISSTEKLYINPFSTGNPVLIDSVKIFNYTLTAEQAKTEYNGGAVKF